MGLKIQMDQMADYLAFCTENSLDDEASVSERAFLDHLAGKTSGVSNRKARLCDVWATGTGEDGERLFLSAVNKNYRNRHRIAAKMEFQLLSQGADNVRVIVGQPIDQGSDES